MSNLSNKSIAIYSVLSKTYSFVKKVDVFLSTPMSNMPNYEIILYCDYDLLKKESGKENNHLFNDSYITLSRMTLSGIFSPKEDENIRQIIRNVSKMVPPIIQTGLIKIKEYKN
jgi:hypothetical protein